MSRAETVTGIAVAAFALSYTVVVVLAFTADREPAPAQPTPAMTSSVGATGMPGRTGTSGGDVR